MRKFAKRCLALLAAMVMLFALAGCNTKEQPQDLVTIELNEVTHSVFYAPQYAAMELGFFEEEGLRVELTNGGGADIGLAGPEASIYVYGEGREDHCVVFAQLTKRDGAFLVSREPDPDFDWKDLAGSYVIGGRAGGVPLMTFESLFRQKGLTPNVDLTVDSSVQFNMMAGAFTGGTGDYVALFEPTASLLEREGKGYILASIGEQAGEVPYTAYFASKSYIEQNPDIIESFTRAVYKGQQWVKEHSAEEIAQAIEPYFPDTDLELLTAVTQRHKDIDAWNDTPIMKQSSFDKLQEIMEQAGELSARVPFDEVVDNSFGEKVTKE